MQAIPDPMKMQVPNGYESWTAEEKLDWLWETLIGSTAFLTSLPELATPLKSSPLSEISVVLQKQELDKVFTRTSDLMEPGRPKVIHARGTTAAIDFMTEADSPYTGLLAGDGGAIGLLRLSLAARPKGGVAVTPSIGLKLLIDGHPSADVLAMNGVTGQGRDFNVFSNPMTNDFTSSNEELHVAQRLLSLFFSRVSKEPRRMESIHLSSQRRNGSLISSPRTPDRLVFHATSEAKALFAGRSEEDFRLVLAEVEAGTRLFDVEAVDGSAHLHIGSITATTSFVSSEGGDRLFFRHVHDPALRKLK